MIFQRRRIFTYLSVRNVIYFPLTAIFALLINNQIVNLLRTWVLANELIRLQFQGSVCLSELPALCHFCRQTHTEVGARLVSSKIRWIVCAPGRARILWPHIGRTARPCGAACGSPRPWSAGCCPCAPAAPQTWSSACRLNPARKPGAQASSSYPAEKQYMVSVFITEYNARKLDFILENILEWMS